ncbi:UdgX family uracil-DNA binding protein [Occallatibacter savannae]|uniref:UdgX family uracil-DNA binding protein n=1 Tax=Occallatibacter savannae TaxID=1002691 RepID=UPI000D69D790|nr:UdgX family uracil-DNA binding protein [Occallatibacter savannae]
MKQGTSPQAILRQSISFAPTFDAWREAVRPLLSAAAHPATIDLADTASGVSDSLFAFSARNSVSESTPVHVPRSFIERAKIVACHRSADRWNLLYRILFRLQSDRNLMKLDVDDDIAEFRRLEHQVKRDLHKMHAFVRFRKVEDETGVHYIAWYEPAHHVLALAAPFFAERFAIMQWAILTPDASVNWDPDEKRLTFGTGVPRERAPVTDDFEALWRTYYSSIFNPARTNLHAMRSEMPVRYWKNLPEIDSLPRLLTEAEGRVEAMLARQPKVTAASFLPSERSLPILQQSIHTCQGCELYRCATQPVFGAGPSTARMMFVGEQPGDEEDRAGKPFIGPAGRLLDTLLAEAEIDRSSVYVTNAVKHFKFTERGKRRLHENPRASEIFACRPWLLAELEAVHPELVVCLGATASKSLFGPNFGLMRDRGKILSSPYAERVIATLHPSAILRATDPERAAQMRSMLVADLRLASATLGAKA